MASPSLPCLTHQSDVALSVPSWLNWWGQVLCNSIHFHLKRWEGVTWPLCAELADQNWVHFNETLYAHCNRAGLMRKLVMGSHPSEWSEVTPKSSPWPRALNSHHSNWTTRDALWKHKYPPRGSTGCLPSRQLWFWWSSIPTLWHVTSLSCPDVLRPGSCSSLPLAGHLTQLGIFHSQCVPLLLLTPTVNNRFRGVSEPN